MRRRQDHNRRGDAGRLAGVAVIASVLASAFGGGPLATAAGAADPVPTVTTTATTTVTTTTVTTAPAAAQTPSAAAPVAAAPAAAAPSRRATGARGLFAAKQAAALPRPATTRGTTAEPVAALAIQLGRAIENGAPAADVVSLRGKLAALVAGRVKTATASQLDAAWAATTPVRLTVLLTALAQVGKRYQYNAAGPDSFDCSGLALFAWSAGNVKLPHNDTQQINAVSPRTEATIQVADLAQYPGHVALYLGVGKAIVHAEQTGVPVRVTDYSASTNRFGSPLP